MLRIVKGITGADSKDSQTQLVEAFLCAVLIEVVAENYRYLMHETAFSKQIQADESTVVDPPLRANERVLSGLFATAISRVSPRSRPEVRVDRLLEDDECEDAESENGSAAEGRDLSPGRVDYLAWYSDSTIAVELKVVHANIDNRDTTRLMQKRWDAVNVQARSAQNFLRQNNQYPKPSAIALLVIVGRRAMADIQRIESRKQGFVEEIESLNGLIAETLKPAWQVNYIVPHEFRASRRKRKGNTIGGVVYTPVISFIANPHL